MNVHHGRVDPFFLEQFGSTQRLGDHHAAGEDRDVAALPRHVPSAELVLEAVLIDDRGVRALHSARDPDIEWAGEIGDRLYDLFHGDGVGGDFDLHLWYRAHDRDVFQLLV